MKHTPGPWRHVAVEGGWDGVMPERPGVPICKLIENNPANARLIAAAPDLLEACFKARTCASIPDSIQEVLKAAIAKATREKQ